jgi:transposase
LSTKIHTLVDALGNPLGFFLTGGQAHDLLGADHLLPAMSADTLIADKAFDADERVITPLTAAGKVAVIPPRGRPRDWPRLRSRPLQSTPPDRELLRQAQAIPCHRHPPR